MRVESNARTYARHLPLVPVEASGVRVQDAAGRWYYDCLAGAGAASLGWNHPAVRESVERVLKSNAPWLTLDLPSPLRDEFVDELLQSMPPELAQRGVVHLCGPTGASAVEAALTLAELATGGDEFVAIEGGFHGCSLGAREVSTAAGLRRNGRSLHRGTHFLPFPQQYRCPFGRGGQEGVALATRAIERLFQSPHSPLVRPAAIIAECVQGEAGSLPAPLAWLRALRAQASSRGIPFIADEVQAGMGRTGAMWSFQHSDIVPDVVVASKGLGAGIPIAVVVLHENLNVWQPGAFTGTFRGNAFAFAAAIATLRFVREQKLVDHVREVGERLLARLSEAGRASACVGDVRGIGLMLGVEMVDPEGTADARGVLPPSPKVARRLQRACFEAGLIVEIGGAYENVVRFLPPLIVTREEVDAIADRFGEALRQVEVGP